MCSIQDSKSLSRASLSVCARISRIRTEVRLDRRGLTAPTSSSIAAGSALSPETAEVGICPPGAPAPSPCSIADDFCASPGEAADAVADGSFAVLVLFGFFVDAFADGCFAFLGFFASGSGLAACAAIGPPIGFAKMSVGGTSSCSGAHAATSGTSV